MNVSVTPPFLLRKFYRNLIWNFPTEEKVLHLTFDDGPVAEVTPFVLDELKKYNAKATFFCIGENVKAHPAIFERIKAEGHAVGNHTWSHLNGWKTKDATYFEDIEKANQIIRSNFFRPPYGKIKKSQITFLTTPNRILDTGYSLIMWDVLSFDFDANTTPGKCFQNVIRNAKPGSIIVFHDSVKAQKNVSVALPETLKYFLNRGFGFKAIGEGN
ncbi:MAG: polysaccharide deacetylase family protein [Bacteroidia bacterium]